MKYHKKTHRSIAASGLALGLFAAGLKADDPDPLVLKVDQTVEITLSHYRCWFPTIHKFRSGEIMVAMSLCADEDNYESAFSAFCISADGGKTWSERHPLGTGAMHDGAWSETPDQ